MPAIQNLVEHLVDYAGLFPPASLELPQVIENYAQYCQGEFSWMLGRLIIPASRLDEFSELALDCLPASRMDGWVISALLPAAQPDSDAMQLGFQNIAAFNQRHQDPANGLASVDTIEIKASTADQIFLTTEALPDAITGFIELPHETDPDRLLAIMSQCPKRLFAKIRTGGVTRDLIPPANQVARFIRSCVKHAIGFKCDCWPIIMSAFVGTFRLEPMPSDADRGTMYGFINVFAGWSRSSRIGTDASQSDLIEISRRLDPSSFEFGESCPVLEKPGIR